MTEVTWIVLRKNDRFLLAQRSLTGHVGGTWVFPGGKIDLEDKTPIDAVNRELKEKVGLEGERLRKLFHICLDNYSIQVFFCDQWHGELKPACEDIIGVGWFTWEEMYTLGQSLAPFVNDSLLYLSYMIQHYDHHPDEWKEQWEKCDDNG